MLCKHRRFVADPQVTPLLLFRRYLAALRSFHRERNEPIEMPLKATPSCTGSRKSSVRAVPPEHCFTFSFFQAFI